jgi:WD40 repeat protein
VECGEPVTTLWWDPARKALICGLKSGIIRVFTREPLGQIDLHGHTDAVHSLIVFQNILLSASWDGSVRTWQGDQLSAGMVIESSRIPVGSIRVMKIFGGRLWLGGVLGVCAIDMQSLQVALSIGCESPVMAVLEYSPTESVIVATLNGTIRVIQQGTGLVSQTIQMSDLEAHYGISNPPHQGGKGRGVGHSNYTWSAKGQHGKGVSSQNASTGIVALEGMLLGNTGKPVVVIGDQSGTCKVLELPNFEFRGQWFAHSKGSDIRNILNTNENNIFITTASDGCLAVWQWQV